MAWERRQSGSSSSLAGGEIRTAKSASVRRDFVTTPRTVDAVADKARFNSVSCGSALNSATKLMPVRYQKGRERQAAEMRMTNDERSSNPRNPSQQAGVFTFYIASRVSVILRHCSFGPGLYREPKQG